MKVRQIPNLAITPHAIEDKGDATGFEEKFQREKERQQKRDERPEIKVSDETVQEAIDDFTKDKAATSNGLRAETRGSGPGLKVVLKDGSGTVIRQLSGEEFIRLRQEVQDGKERGKILDQKL